MQYIDASSGFFNTLGISGYLWKNKGRVAYDAKAKKHLEIDKNLPFSLEAAADKKEQPSPTLTFLSEALVQTTFLMILRKDWLQQNERDFIEYVDDRYKTFFNQIRDAIKASSSEESDRLLSAFHDAYRVYFRHEPKGSTISNLESAFDAIKEQEILLKFAAELTRKINLKVMNGALMEQPSSTLINQQSVWLKDSMKRIRSLLPVPYIRGKLFARVSALLDEIDKDFDKLPVREEHLHRSLISE